MRHTRGIIGRVAVLGAASAALTLLLGARVSMARSGEPYWGDSLWGAKEMSFAHLKRRARFQVVVPSDLPGDYRLTKNALVWVRDAPGQERWRPRQAAALFYNRADRTGMTVVVEAAEVGVINAHSNIYPIMGGGYFFRNMPQGSILRFYRAGRTDVGVLTNELSEQEFSTVFQRFEAKSGGAGQ